MLVCELIKSGLISRSYSKFALDLIKVINQQTAYATCEKVCPLESYSNFYMKFLKDPSLYIHKAPGLATVLNKMKSKGKLLFYTTNFHAEFTEFCFNYAIGPKWLDCFDLVLVNCRKPIFAHGESPFY